MDYLEFLRATLQRAAKTALSYFGTVEGTVKAGDPSQVLTEADLVVGKQLVADIQVAFPDYNIIDEESGVIDNGSRFTWVVDPIDGTSNFAVGTPDFGIMVGLLDGETPIAGGIAVPAHGRLYLAQKGLGATCNGEPIHVTAQTDVGKLLISFATDADPADPERNSRHGRLFGDVVRAAQNVRNSGSETIDPMYVAEGRYGGRINLSSKIWDNVAPQVIVEAAGGPWTQLNGKPIDYHEPLTKVEQNFALCIAPPAIHAQLLAIIARQPRPQDL